MAPKPRVPRDYNGNYVQCRTFGHTWHVGPLEHESGVFYAMVLVCSVCHTRRLDTINLRTGGIVARRYEYPDDYRSAPGEGLRRFVYRIEFVRRHVEGADGE